jgi:hypothetical protein
VPQPESGEKIHRDGLPDLAAAWKTVDVRILGVKRRVTLYRIRIL